MSQQVFDAWMTRVYAGELDLSSFLINARAAAECDSVSQLEQRIARLERLIQREEGETSFKTKCEAGLAISQEELSNRQRQ